MGKIKKIWMLVLLAVCVIYAEEEKIFAEAAEPFRILALGDSIAQGYGLENAKRESYGAVLAERLGADFQNEGVNGLKSGDLLEHLESGVYDEGIEKADVILLSIGSNDVLKPCIVQAAESVGIQTEYANIYSEIQKRYREEPQEIGELLTDLRRVKERLRDNREVLTSCEQFEENFEEIIRLLREKNPYAVIYADNVYNPYLHVNYSYGPIEVLNLSELTEPYIRKVNEAFHSSTENYTIVNTYLLFQENGYTNVNTDFSEEWERLSLDPHPNVRGHLRIAEAVYEKMDVVPPEAKAEKRGKSIRITANERVRFTEGKKLYLRSGKESLSYMFSGKEEFSEQKNGEWVCSIPTEQITGKGKIRYWRKYEIVIEENAMKDGGNNSLQKTKLGRIRSSVPGVCAGLLILAAVFPAAGGIYRVLRKTA